MGSKITISVCVSLIIAMAVGVAHAKRVRNFTSTTDNNGNQHPATADMNANGVIKCTSATGTVLARAAAAHAHITVESPSGFDRRVMIRYLISSVVVIGTIIATGCDDYTIADKAKMDACATGIVLTKADYDQHPISLSRMSSKHLLSWWDNVPVPSPYPIPARC